jgi:hypothetical protein
MEGVALVPKYENEILKRYQNNLIEIMLKEGWRITGEESIKEEGKWIRHDFTILAREVGE